MPLSEFYRVGNRKTESAQQKSSNLSLIPDNEFVELVWEKGQIMMQGQSSKSKKTPVYSNFQFHTPKLRDNNKEIPNATTSKNGKFETYDSTFSNDIAVPVPSVEMNLNQDDDDMARWLNYPAVDDYCRDVLIPELSQSGVTVNEQSTRTFKRTGDLYPWSFGSGVSDLVSSPNQVCGDSGSVPGQVSAGGFNRTNFSHFLRPIRPNLHIDVGPSGASSSKDNHKSPFVDQNGGGINKETGLVSQAQAKPDSSRLVAKPVEEPPNRGEQCEDKSKNEKCTHKCRADNEKTVEPIVAASSVCSGNSAERASNDLTNNLKRKSRDTEDSEWQSEDVDEELVGVKRKTARGTGSKRSRAAEVHNLSERRRRDRINEKMRALQELIPNCNKVDKASMLDEAIEYLKTLQLQVQIMSMGAGLYMPPMMFPTGMQHMHAAHMPHFSPMGLGMSMGYGMGMMDLNGGSRGCPMIPVQGAPYPIPSGPSNFHGPVHQVFGHPGQVMPMTVSGSPMVPLPARPPMDSNSKDLMQNTHAVHNADPSRSMNQTSTQFQSRNEGFDHSTMLQKNDLASDAVGGGATVKSLSANETIPSRADGSD